MLVEAEKYSEEDNKLKEKVEAKNSLEGIAFQMKSMLEDENIKKGLSEELKESLNKEVTDLLLWLENNTDEEKEVYDNRKLEFQEKMKPILQGGIPPGTNIPSETTNSNESPNIEDVD